jgi:hypothetical protein
MGSLEQLDSRGGEVAMVQPHMRQSAGGRG